MEKQKVETGTQHIENEEEKAETISFKEFKAWLTGLILGKRGQLPDLADWKEIKKMMDRVVDEKETVFIPQIQPSPKPFYPGPYGDRTDPWPSPRWVPSPERYWANPNIVCETFASGDTYGEGDVFGSEKHFEGVYGDQNITISTTSTDSVSEYSFDQDTYEAAFNMMMSHE